MLKTISDKVMKIQEDMELITDIQHDFRNNRTFFISFLEFLNDIYKDQDRKITPEVNNFDFQYVFDKVPREKVLCK